MSATRYTLRTCSTCAGMVVQQGTIQAPKIDTNILGSQECSNTASAVALELHTLDNCTTDGATRSYSDVVASWPSSPASAIGEDAPSGDAETLARSARVEEALVIETEVVSPNNMKNIVTNFEDHESDTSLLSDLSNRDNNQNLWTKVVHRRSRSLDSLRKNKMTVQKVKVVKNWENGLTAEQDTV